MPTVADPSLKVSAQDFVGAFESNDPHIVKSAEDAVNSFLRMRLREEGFFRKILPPIPVSNDDLDRQVDTDKPVIILDKEPNSPAAASVPFATQPFAKYIKAPRYRVMFDRIQTPKFMKDVDELRTYDMDVRQILSDNAIKDMLAEEDGKAIATVNALISTTPGTTVVETGVAQFQSFTGGISRESVNDALKILPSTPAHLSTATVLINNISILDIQKWGRDEVGGDLSEEILRNGFGERNFLGCRWIVTIKTRLVPTGDIYMFAEPKFLGKFFVLNDTTMHIKREAFMLEFYAWESIGAAIGNVAAVARARFV